jgi:hypothetical protein
LFRPGTTPEQRRKGIAAFVLGWGGAIGLIVGYSYWHHDISGWDGVYVALLFMLLAAGGVRTYPSREEQDVKSSDDRVFRRIASVVVVILLAIIAFFLWDNSHQPSSSTNQVVCSAKDALSCYNEGTNKPVPPAPQSVTFNGTVVPTFGLLPSNCDAYTACTYLGNVGVWSVWDTNPKGPSHLEAVWGPPADGSSGT